MSVSTSSVRQILERLSGVQVDRSFVVDLRLGMLGWEEEKEAIRLLEGRTMVIVLMGAT